jgi:hypothetical protein
MIFTSHVLATPGPLQLQKSAEGPTPRESGVSVYDTLLHIIKPIKVGTFVLLSAGNENKLVLGSCDNHLDLSNLAHEVLKPIVKCNLSFLTVEADMARDRVSCVCFPVHLLIMMDTVFLMVTKLENTSM